eukprot:215969-Rhodomonas_salina.4
MRARVASGITQSVMTTAGNGVFKPRKLLRSLGRCGESQGRSPMRCRASMLYRQLWFLVSAFARMKSFLVLSGAAIGDAVSCMLCAMSGTDLADGCAMSGHPGHVSYAPTVLPVGRRIVIRSSVLTRSYCGVGSCTVLHTNGTDAGHVVLPGRGSRGESELQSWQFVLRAR